MRDDAPTRITDPSSHGDSLARALVAAAKSDAPAPSAKVLARAKLERFLATEEQPTNSSVVPEKHSAPLSNDAFFSPSAARVTAANAATKSEPDRTEECNDDSLSFAPDGNASKREASVVHIQSVSHSESAIDELRTVDAGAGVSSPVLAPVPPSTAPASETVKSNDGTNKTIVASVLGAAVILVGGTLGALYMLETGQPRTQVGSEVRGSNERQHPVQTTGQNAQRQSVRSASIGPGSVPSRDTAANDDGTNGANAAGHANTALPSGTDSSHNAPSNRVDRGLRPARHSSSSSAAMAVPSNNTPTANSSASVALSAGSCAARCRGDGACMLACQRQARPANDAAPSSGSPASAAVRRGPETPSRNDVINAMREVQSAVRACAVRTGQTGIASITIDFASSGRVISATVAPPFAGTAVGSCMARAVRAATVPAFTRPTFRVSYPFSL